MRIRLVFLPCLTLSLATSLSSQSGPTQYTILYSGRLMGYARTPDVQTRTTTGGAPNSAAAQYLTLFKNAQDKLDNKGPVLRLGMGDNFAPDLFARTFQLDDDPYYPRLKEDKTCYTATVRVPKDRFYFNDAAGHHEWAPFTLHDTEFEKRAGAGVEKIPFDNVAEFLAQAKYDAIVPGKHDFYSGPEWLRLVARLLATRKVHILGANLYIATARAPQPTNVFPRTPERLAPPVGYVSDMGDASLDLPPAVFPYKQQFVVKKARRVLFAKPPGELVPPSRFRSLQKKEVAYSPAIERPQICREAGTVTAGDLMTAGDPIAALAANKVCYDLVAADEACKLPLKHQIGACRSLAPEGVPHPTADVVYLFRDPEAKLAPGLNHAFCAHVIGSKSILPSCTLFPVQMPFFRYGDNSPEAGKPYVMTTGGVAVFGIVDADLLSNVGLLNSGWNNVKDSQDTVTKVAAPDYALKQALELCATEEACEAAPKVLMAQMSYARATQLIAQMRRTFDVVLSQADGYHNTEGRHLTEEPTAAQTAQMTKPAPMFVLTPPEPFSLDANPTIPHPKPTFTPKVSRAVITRGSKWVLDNSVDAGTPEEAGLPECPGTPVLQLSQASHDALAALKGVKLNPPAPIVGPDPSDDLRDLALLTIQRSLRTDVAFLQRRDLFDADRQGLELIPRNELQNQINRVFWKGDFAVRLHVTGATLKKLMKQSKKFDEMDHDLLSTEVEIGRGLVSIGIWNDPKDSDSYYINGAKMDDTKLYTVAATEFLGLGDTGYSDLATPDVPPALRIEDFTGFRALSSLVCQEIVRVPAYQDIPCDTTKMNVNYFDTSSQIPNDLTPGFTAATRYTTLPKRFVRIPVPAAGADGRAQQRPFFSLNLESLDFAYGGTYIKHVGQVGAKFAGISSAGVSSSGSNSLSSDHKLRAIYDYGPGTVYLLSDSAFTKTNTSSALFATIATNMWGMEGGGTVRFYRTRPFWLSAQFSGRFEGQLTDPIPTAIKLSPGSNLLLYPPQTSTVYGRAGLRAEFNDVYWETGLEQIDSQHIISSFNFALPTTPPSTATCTPAAGTQFNCTGNAIPGAIASATDLANLLAKPLTTDYLTGGAYLNFNIKFPLWSRKDAAGADQTWYFTLTNKGDWYFNSRNDTSVQTRYLDKFTPSFSVPLFGKLTLTPKVDFILFEDKTAHRHYASVTPALSLSYTFNYREGMNFWRALGYGAITQTQPVAASK